MDAAQKLDGGLGPTTLKLFDSQKWSELASLSFPRPIQRTDLIALDRIVFAMGQCKRFAEGIKLGCELFEIEGTYRRASGIAYLHYSASLEDKTDRDRRRATSPEERDRLHENFGRWSDKAIELASEKAYVKECYRRGVFVAQILNQRDKEALKWFGQAITRYEQLAAETRSRFGDLRRAYARSLYASARSAFRLRDIKLARSLCFGCIRVDKEDGYVAELFKMTLAGKICLETGELDAAERALRIALDAGKGRDRSFVFGYLADLEIKRQRFAEAENWVEKCGPEPRRPAHLWRRVGDARKGLGQLDAAIVAYQAALLKDKGGRHLTLVAIGQIELERGRLKEAERAFEQANEFRIKKYAGEDAHAVAGLAEIEARRAASETSASDTLRPPVKAGVRSSNDSPQTSAKRHGLAS